MGYIDDAQTEFKNCLALFPELSKIELIIIDSIEFSGAIGHKEDNKYIILFVPSILIDKSTALLRPLILHELSHMISLGNVECGKIFQERADEKSKELWALLKKSKALKCSDYRRV